MSSNVLLNVSERVCICFGQTRLRCPITSGAGTSIRDEAPEPHNWHHRLVESDEQLIRYPTSLINHCVMGLETSGPLPRYKKTPHLRGEAGDLTSETSFRSTTSIDQIPKELG